MLVNKHFKMEMYLDFFVVCSKVIKQTGFSHKTNRLSNTLQSK